MKPRRRRMAKAQHGVHGVVRGFGPSVALRDHLLIEGNSGAKQSFFVSGQPLLLGMISEAAADVGDAPVAHFDQVFGGRAHDLRTDAQNG